MPELCGQTFGGLGYKAACSFGQSHRCELNGAHDEKCECQCGAKLGEPKATPDDHKIRSTDGMTKTNRDTGRVG